MGRGNSLTDHEKEMIDAFEKEGHSQREIAKKINRSKWAGNNYIRNKNKTPKKILKEKSGSIQISPFFRGDGGGGLSFCTKVYILAYTKKHIS